MTFPLYTKTIQENNNYMMETGHLPPRRQPVKSELKECNNIG